MLSKRTKNILNFQKQTFKIQFLAFLLKFTKNYLIRQNLI